ncbi:unnamed protein product [Lampetra planeri]
MQPGLGIVNAAPTKQTPKALSSGAPVPRCVAATAAVVGIVVDLRLGTGYNDDDEQRKPQDKMKFVMELKWITICYIQLWDLE